MILVKIVALEKKLTEIKKEIAVLSENIENIQDRINIIEINNKLKASTIWDTPKRNVDQDNFIFDLYQ